MSEFAAQLFAQEVARQVLSLRETLVRFDENLKAHQLMQSVPFFLWDHPAIVKARDDQYEMVKHVVDPAEYAPYYEGNPHERRFEQQYGIEPTEAHQHIYRVQFLRQGLGAQCERDGVTPEKLRLVDLSANDGWMAVNLGQLGYTTDCVDLHPGNCEIAREREPGVGDVHQEDLHDFAKRTRRTWNAVVCFETLEHVADPAATMAAMAKLCAPGGRLYVSTPHEAVEGGNLPSWDFVEAKGHVRVFRQQDLLSLLQDYGKVERFEIGPDGVMVAEVAP